MVESPVVGGTPARARLRGRGGGARALAVRRLAGPSRGRAGRPHQRRPGAADRRARSRRAVPDQARRPPGHARGHLAARGHRPRLRSRGRRRGGELGGHAADRRRARRAGDPRRPRLGARRGPGDRTAAADRHRRRWSAGSSPARAPARADEDPTDDVLPQVRIADLVQRVDVDLYGGYVVVDPEATEESGGRNAGTADLEPATLDQLPPAGTFTGVAQPRLRRSSGGCSGRSPCSCGGASCATPSPRARGPPTSRTRTAR